MQPGTIWRMKTSTPAPNIVVLHVTETYYKWVLYCLQIQRGRGQADVRACRLDDFLDEYEQVEGPVEPRRDTDG